MPQADEKVIKKVLSDENELNARIYRFPTSAIHLNGKKINYYEFLCSGADDDCSSALLRIISRVSLKKIDVFIDGTEYLTEIQKEFYKYYIASRFDKILCSARDRLGRT